MNTPKIIVSTSNAYHHCLRIWIYLFQKNWGVDAPVEIVGYDRPDFDLPDNFTFYSMGAQIGGAKNFSGDLRKYFEQQSLWFLWFMEDSWVKGVNFEELEKIKRLMNAVPACVKINLSTATSIQEHTVYGDIEGLTILENARNSLYRLSMQPSIWYRDYLLKYMIPGMTPWEMEVLPAKDEFRIFGSDHAIVDINEGVTKHNIFDYNLKGISGSQIHEMEDLGLLNAIING